MKDMLMQMPTPTRLYVLVYSTGSELQGALRNAARRTMWGYDHNESDARRWLRDRAREQIHLFGRLKKSYPADRRGNKV